MSYYKQQYNAGFSASGNMHRLVSQSQAVAKWCTPMPRPAQANMIPNMLSVQHKTPAPPAAKQCKAGDEMLPEGI